MQKRTKRNKWFFVTPMLFFTLAFIFLTWAVIRLNLPPSVLSRWPWKVQILDVQSATTALTITGGLILARAQYANTVKPMIGWLGAVEQTTAYSNRHIWPVDLINGCSTPAYFRADGYFLLLKARQVTDFEESNVNWVTRDDIIAFLETMDVRHGLDYELNYLGPSLPLSLSSPIFRLALFTPKAMHAIDDLLILVRAKDLVGDVHERIIYCMRGADRNPK